MRQMLNIVTISFLLVLPNLSSATVSVTLPHEDDNDEQYELDAKEVNQKLLAGEVGDLLAKQLEQIPTRPMHKAMSLTRLQTQIHHHQEGVVHKKHRSSHTGDSQGAEGDAEETGESAPAASPAAAPAPASMSAQEAANKAHRAASVANKVAEHSMNVTKHAKKALTHALGALHDARVETSGLSDDQKQSLKKAEGRLREATKTADFGKLDKLKFKSDESSKTEKEQVREEIESLRERLRKNEVEDADVDKALDELEADLDKDGGASTDEVKAEVERLKKEVDRIEEANERKYYPVRVAHSDQAAPTASSEKDYMRDVKMQPLDDAGGKVMKPLESQGEVTPVQEKGIDIDTQMPYGDLEPFGREDTAQELTEGSIKESDEMVDQLERAEVAEEKRAVFRALTRLRGAAITAFDGVARSQTGNIDEYSKVHKWRKAHPMHHLADEESDISKWAFPDNADLLQKGFKASAKSSTNKHL